MNPTPPVTDTCEDLATKRSRKVLMPSLILQSRRTVVVDRNDEQGEGEYAQLTRILCRQSGEKSGRAVRR